MEVEKLDKVSRDMLKYLNSNADLSATTLADAFNQHYKITLLESLETLSYLESKSLLRLKTENNERAQIIHITHLGRTYEQLLQEQEKE